MEPTPPVPSWMKTPYVEPFFNIYDENKNLLPYIDIPLNDFVRPCLRPKFSNGNWSETTFVHCENSSHLLKFCFKVENEQQIIIAECKNILKIGPKIAVYGHFNRMAFDISLLRDPSKGIIDWARIYCDVN